MRLSSLRTQVQGTKHKTSSWHDCICMATNSARTTWHWRILDVCGMGWSRVLLLHACEHVYTNVPAIDCCQKASSCTALEWHVAIAQRRLKYQEDFLGNAGAASDINVCITFKLIKLQRSMTKNNCQKSTMSSRVRSWVYTVSDCSDSLSSLLISAKLLSAALMRAMAHVCMVGAS